MITCLSRDSGCLTVVLNFSSIFYSSVSLLGINETVDCTITANDEDLLYVMTGKVKPRAVRVDVFLFRNTEMEKTEQCNWIPVIEKKTLPLLVIIVPLQVKPVTTLRLVS